MEAQMTGPTWDLGAGDSTTGQGMSAARARRCLRKVLSHAAAMLPTEDIGLPPGGFAKLRITIT
jgi:hypothetical protein